MLRLLLICILLITSYLNSFSQCVNGNPSIWENTWTSCEKVTNPISSYGATHWIRYDLGSVRNLSNTWIWNTNDPDRLDQGFREVKVDCSVDGINWARRGSMTFRKGTGSAVYSGFKGPELTNIKARYVLFTSISNYGDPHCAGIAEIKFNLLPDNIDGIIVPPIIEADLVIDAQGIEFLPNPVSGMFTVKGEFSNYSIQILDANGILHQDLTNQASPIEIDINSLSQGMYFVKVANNNNSKLWVEQMIKM